MGRKSIKEDKNYYFRLREEAGFTRAEASEVMNISEARIEKIENDRVTVVPEDIVEMSKGYKKPALCNYYCTHECRIGKDNLNIIEESSIAEISIGILDTLNTLEEKKARLVSIVADGKITDDEKNEFISIGKDLKRINKIIKDMQQNPPLVQAQQAAAQRANKNNHRPLQPKQGYERTPAKSFG